VEGRRLGTPLTLPAAPGLPDLAGATGILGGTFDPPHLGHLALAQDVLERLALGRVLFVPAGIPPHKPDRLIGAPSHRRAMVELAIAGNDAFALSAVELDRSGPSYTADTVDLLRGEAARAGADDRFVVILSGDSVALLPTWHEPERLLRVAPVVVVERPGFRTPGRPWVGEHFPGLEDRVLFLAGPRLCHSSSDIRARVSEGRSIRYLVPPPVAEYIAQHGLYADAAWGRN
jgi:nicotinate-nucleotide adenylyltransferase